jgi:hypothetical protein
MVFLSSLTRTDNSAKIEGDTLHNEEREGKLWKRFLDVETKSTLETMHKKSGKIALGRNDLFPRPSSGSGEQQAE